MAWDWGGGLGGGISGAAAGMGAFGPVGAAVGGIAGLLGGGISGGGPAEYEPSPLQEALAGYGFDQVKASPALKRSITKQFRSLKQGGNRGGAEAFLEAYRGRYSNPDSNPEFIEKRLAKSYGKPIDFNQGGFGDIAKSVYGSQGLGFTAEDYGNFANEAKTLGIRSPQAFGDMLKRKLIAEGKVATPAQEQLSYFWGPSGRDANGRLTNKYGAGVNIDYSMENEVV